MSVSGLEAGGWGAASIVVALALMALGVLGYLWNPYSDPEAMFIAAFGAVALIAALVKIGDPASLFTDGEALFDYVDTSTSASIGLWLVALMGLASLLSGLWIVFSRPRAEARL